MNPSETTGNGNGAAAKQSRAELTPDAVAKLFNAEVTIPVIDRKTGEPATVRDADGGGQRYRTETVKLRAEHILAFRRIGNAVQITTIDGQKLTASAA